MIYAALLFPFYKLKSREKEIKYIAQCHLAIKWQSQELNPESEDLKTSLLHIMLLILQG